MRRIKGLRCKSEGASQVEARTRVIRAARQRRATVPSFLPGYTGYQCRLHHWQNSDPSQHHTQLFDW